jgi:Flp pilus assembly protein TadB
MQARCYPCLSNTREKRLFRDIISGVKMHLRRFLAFLCLAAIFFAALSPLTPALLFAFLIPVWFFFATVISFLLAVAAEICVKPLFAFLPGFSPRPPPIR